MKVKEDCRLVLVGKAFDGRTQDTREKDLGIESLTIHAEILMERGLLWAGEGKAYAKEHGLDVSKYENTAKMY